MQIPTTGWGWAVGLYVGEESIEVEILAGTWDGNRG